MRASVHLKIRSLPFLLQYYLEYTKNSCVPHFEADPCPIACPVKHKKNCVLNEASTSAKVWIMVKMECCSASALRFGQGGRRRAHKSSTIKILPQASCKQNLSFFLIRLKLLNSYQQIVLATSVAISIAETILYTASQTTTWPLLTQLQKYTISSPLQYSPLTLHATNYKLSPTI